MSRESESRSSVVRRFLAAMAEGEKRVFGLEDALPFWSTPHQARKALSRLEKRGWVERLERGLYLIVPLEAGPEGRWTEDPLVIATHLSPEGAAAYWTALHYWRMTEQVPRTTFVQTTRRRHRPRVTILGVRYRFVTVSQQKLFGITVESSDGSSFRITDEEKTVIDGCDRPDLCGGIRQIAAALQSGEPLDWEKVDGYLDRLGSGAVYKRLGYLTDSLGVQVQQREERFARWREAMSQGIANLEPVGTAAGPIDTSWRLRINVPGLERSR